MCLSGAMSKRWASTFLENGTVAADEDVSLYGDLFEAAAVGAKVDRTKRLVTGVVLLAPESPTRRRSYSPECMSGAVKLYEGARVNVNHPPEHDPARVRDVRDLAGRVVRGSVKMSQDGKMRGDLEAFKGQAGDLLLDLCESAADTIGMSHNALGQERPHPTINGWQQVETIVLVRSVDLVTFAGSMGGLFESGRDAPAAPNHSKEKQTMEPNEVIRNLTREQLVTINPTLHSQLVESGRKEIRDGELKTLQESVAATKAENETLKGEVGRLKSIDVIESVLQKPEYSKLPDAFKGKVRDSLKGAKDLTEAGVIKGIGELTSLVESMGMKVGSTETIRTNLTEGAGGFGGGQQAEKKEEVSEASLFESMCGVPPEEKKA